MEDSIGQADWITLSNCVNALILVNSFEIVKEECYAVKLTLFILVQLKDFYEAVYFL